MALFTTRSNPLDEAWRAGEGPYRGTLGPNRESDSDPVSYRSGFVANVKDNPNFARFFADGNFSSETAQRSQEKINQASRNIWANFKNPADNKFADDFLAKYSEGVIRGIIAKEDAVDPTNPDLSRLASEPAPSGSNEKSQSTVGKFPTQGVQV